jgi:hypothetical protein
MVSMPKAEWVKLWEEFDAIGIAGVKARLRDPVEKDFVKFCAQMWLDETEDRRHQRALDAAEHAADGAKKAARWAVWAAVINLVAVVVALATK